MLDKERLGREIKRLRKSKKFTQSQLAKDICNQSEISRIEAGDFFPSIDLLYLLASRLNVPLLYFFEIITHEQVEEIKNIRRDVWTFSQNKQYKELHEYVSALLPNKNNYHSEIEKFLLWNKNLSDYYLGKINVDYCLVELSLLLKKNTLGLDRELDLYIKNSIANLLAEKKEYKKSGSVYNEILNDELDTKETEKLKIKVYYNYGKLLFLENEFRSSLDLTTKGIELAIFNSDMTLLGQLYYQQASSMEELDFPFEDVAKAFQRAFFFFDLLNLEMYKKIILEKKAMFFTRELT